MPRETRTSLLTRRDRLPARTLPILYFGLAHLSLAAAALNLALAPASVAGFHYHPRMVFVVHLVTVGWITSSILGALHLVGPMALRTAMPARKADFWMFVLYVGGVSGVTLHFLINEFSGIAFAGLMTLIAVAHVARKTLLPLASAPVPRAVKACFVLAFSNFGLAALWGVVLAVNKMWPFLPGYSLSHVWAHAHLAGLGWATMMVFAAGYRLLPMLLPSAMPPEAGVWTSAVVLETGVLGLFAALVTGASWLGVSAVVTVLGIGAFFVQVGWMKLHPRRPAKDLPRPDLGVVQVLVALFYFLAAAGLGLYLAFAPVTAVTLKLVLVYGVCALVGFLAQIVVGVATRLMPLYAWLAAAARLEGTDVPPVSAHTLPDRRLQAATFVCWLAGVPALAAGLYLDRHGLVATAGWLLLAAAVSGGLSHAVVLRLARTRSP